MTMNLLFVDSRVEQYQQIVSSVNANTQCVVFDFHSDSFASLLAKCNKPSYNSIGLLQHNYHLPHFQMLSSMSPALLQNNNDFSSWNQFRDFITSLKNQKNIQNFDMMACALYSDPSWKAVLDYVENVTGVNIRASLDDTGSATFGGNWFLETDNVNLKTVYFTDAIDKYDGLLGSSADNSGFITTNYELYVWGQNGFTQLSTLSNPTTVPTLYPNMSNVKQVSLSYGHILILKTDGSVYACGYNSNGQLGDGTTTQRNTPVQVKNVSGTGFLSNIVAISAGITHSVFLDFNGSVYACGFNIFGQLGDGTTTDRYTPVQVVGVSNIVSISTGYYHSMFLGSNGSVYACGSNISGQLGDASTTQRNSPVQVVGVNGTGFVSNIIAISAGVWHSMFLASNGSVYACGRNNFGNLGDGTFITRSIPVQVKGVGGTGFLSNIVAISAGNNYSIFLASNGDVYGVGSNNFGELGYGTTSYSEFPIQVKNVGGNGSLGNIVSISTGDRHSIFLGSNGSVYACGSNEYGQLGNGSRNQQNTPVLVNTSVTNIKRLHDILPPPPPTFGSFSIASKTFGDAAFAITPPSSNSNGVFSYSSSNTSVATVSGSNINIVGAGSTIITATQASTSDYETGSVTATFVVAKANPIIQAWSLASKTFGDAAFTITTPSSNSNGSFSYSSSNTSVATVSGSNITIVGAGSTTITATQASTSNYDTGSITATFVVAKAIPTINVTLNDGNNNTITPSNNIYTVVFNKNKIPRMDKLTLTSSSNNNASALSSVVQSGNSLVQYSSNGNIRVRNNGTVTIKVSQDETSNYLATEKTITLYITALAIQGRRPVFLRGL